MNVASTPAPGRSHDLRPRPRPESGQLPAADAPELPRPGRAGVSRPRRDHPRPPAAHLCGALRALPPPRLGPGGARHRARRHRRGDARQHARDDRVPLRGADDRRRAQHPEHPPRRRRPRLLPRPRRGQGADHRPRILQGRGPGPRTGRREALRDRRRRSGISPAPASASADSATRRSWRRATRPTTGRCPATSGTRSR